MRKLKVTVWILFIASIVLFGANMVKDRFFSDHTAPVISAAEDSVVVSAVLSVEEQEQALLSGITATDDVDGDLTADVRIASLSRFSNDGTRTVTYLVFDSSDNGTSLSRTVSYTDYYSPVIRVQEPLRVDVPKDDEIDITESITAVDALDGDITSQVHVTFNRSTYYADPGDYEAVIQVSNSAGDSRMIPVTVTVIDSSDSDERGKNYPMLSEYIVYTSVGAEVDYRSYLTGYIQNEVEYDLASDEEGAAAVIAGTYIESNVDYSTPGVYTVNFIYTNRNEQTAVTRMYVVVDEAGTVIPANVFTDSEDTAVEE